MAKSGKMANLAIQSLAYFFILLGGLLMVVAVILPFWKEPDYEVNYFWGFFKNFPAKILILQDPRNRLFVHMDVYMVKNHDYNHAKNRIT